MAQEFYDVITNQVYKMVVKKLIHEDSFNIVTYTRAKVSSLNSDTVNIKLLTNDKVEIPSISYSSNLTLKVNDIVNVLQFGDKMLIISKNL